MSSVEPISDEELAAEAARIGLPVAPDEIATLAIGVRRNREMAAVCRTLIDADSVPDFSFRPLRRAAKRG